jgi:putative ABC transport system permease protein
VMAKGLQDQGIEFSVPIGQLIIFLLVAALAGVLSAILPARRASRVRVLEALSYE